MKINSIFLYLVCLSILSSSVFSQVTFSEIMFDVATNEYHDEYVEIFNLSYSDTMDITGWVFSDSSGFDQLLSVENGNKIPPRSFALILDGSYFSNSNTYDSIVSGTIPILTISDNSFGSSGLSNTNPEHLSIFDSTGKLLTSYRYSTGNLPGFSDEKIDLDLNNEPFNWADSRILGGTPGGKNSVSPYQLDPGLDDQSLVIADIIFNNLITEIDLKIYNYGLLAPADSLEIFIFSDTNKNELLDLNEPLIGNAVLPVSTQVVGFEWSGMAVGEHYITASIYYAADENKTNNQVQRKVQVYNGSPQLHFNEIKFLTTEGEAEWIELVNAGDEDIYLKGWAIADLSDTVKIDTPLFMKSESYLVISNDTLFENYDLVYINLLILNTFPVLNDQEDKIFLLNPLAEIEEDIFYTRQWLEGEDYRYPSLERINPFLNSNQAVNWGPCVDPNRSTPGRKNSIYSDLRIKSHSLNVSPNPFSPDADGIDDVTVISGEIPENSARISIQIFDIRGRLIRTLTDNGFTGSDFYFVWDGRDNQDRISRIGIYIIFVQAINDRLGVLREMKTTVVLAQKL